MRNKKLILLGLALISINTSSLLANSKQLTFSTKIHSVCGVEIQDSEGAIDFKDTSSNNQASFKVKTNSKQGFSKVKFTNITKSENIQNENGIFKINNTIDIDWNNPQAINVNHNEEQKVIAKINKNSNEIVAGDARVTTVLELQCIDN